MQSFRFINILRQMLLGACLCGFLFGRGIENEEKQKEQERIQEQVQEQKLEKVESEIQRGEGYLVWFDSFPELGNSINE